MESRRRRSSISITPTNTSITARRASVGSLLMTSSRPPLALLGPQITPAHVFADSQSLSALEDSKPRPSWNEETSGILTNMNTGPSYSTSHTRLISTPARMHPNYSSRRASLPAVSLSSHVSVPPPSLGVAYPPFQQPADSRLLDQLQSYVLTGKKRSIQSIHDDKPRSDRAPSPRAPFVSRIHPPGEDNDAQDSDDGELARQLDRAKLRAIDDGNRRPSLPINIPPSQLSSSSREPLDDLNPPSSPAPPKPLPDLPSSDPGPSATAAFDLNFIFGERRPSNGLISLPHDQHFVATRRMSVSLDTGTDAREWEDSFARFVDQNDQEYSDRRGEWTFTRQSPPLTIQDAMGIWKCSTLVIRGIPPDKQAVPMLMEMPRSPSSSQVRVHIHRHSRAPAYSLMLGDWTHLSPSRSTLLLAPKKVHLHVTVKKDSPYPPRRRPSVFSNKEITSRFVSTASAPPDQTIFSRSDEDLDDFRLPPPGYIPPYVDLQMMVEPSDRSSNNHATAFTTLEPEVRDILLDQIRSRYTLGGRIKRVLGAGPPSPPTASTSNPTQRHAIEGTYAPPWMLMAPGYLKEENDRKSKRDKPKSRPSMDDSRSSRPSSRAQARSNAADSGSHAHTMSVSNEERGRRERGRQEPERERESSLPPRNDILETISDDTMCMAIPLWDFRVQNGFINGGQELPPPSARRWLFVTYIPFTFVKTPPPSLHHLHLRSLFFRSGHAAQSKKRARNGSAATVSSPGGSSSLRSFRVVARILTHHELRRSGLRHPTAAADEDPDYERTRRSTSGEEPFSAVIAVCHDSQAGNVEYIPEGLDRLGLCGNEARFVHGATTPFTFERDPTQLSPIGRDVIEITWAGCLALMHAPT
ncbi:hypothetical protein BS47DRAFT_1352081 [Hydnum rufescens UP504]|uniref:Uncharacterized protein n=1 Tax=Hydnum rufescens UP504 TaxID=1448309 RepID=A0A9P6DQ72_9AGAM|nr:hypothetical protein BS47DRAFT_1352081 [Hydnum rufescens UP504]